MDGQNGLRFRMIGFGFFNGFGKFLLGYGLSKFSKGFGCSGFQGFGYFILADTKM